MARTQIALEDYYRALLAELRDETNTGVHSVQADHLIHDFLLTETHAYPKIDRSVSR